MPFFCHDPSTPLFHLSLFFSHSHRLAPRDFSVFASQNPSHSMNANTLLLKMNILVYHPLTSSGGLITLVPPPHVSEAPTLILWRLDQPLLFEFLSRRLVTCAL